MPGGTSTAFVFATMPSPVGKLKLVASERALAAVLWDKERPAGEPLGATREAADQPVLVAARRQLEEYFARRRTAFELPLEFHGSAFQQRVWAELLKIPYGETRSYGEIAHLLGDKNLMRAVGAANGQNPISIIAPCHRVIGSSGALVGFGGGLARKAQLLDLERGTLAFDFGGNPG